MNVLVNLNNITVCLLMQAKAKVVQIHKPTFMTKEKCPKIGADDIPFLEVFSCEQSKTSSAMHCCYNINNPRNGGKFARDNSTYTIGNNVLSTLTWRQ